MNEPFVATGSGVPSAFTVTVPVPLTVPLTVSEFVLANELSVGVMRAEDLMEDAEISADDFAADGSDPLDTASALVKIGRSNTSDAQVIAGIAALGGFRSLDRRVRRLADEGAITHWSFEWRPMLLSAAALIILWGSATLAPQRANMGMTMRFGERCSHSLHKGQGKCPECERKQAETMPGCGH